MPSHRVVDRFFVVFPRRETIRFLSIHLFPPCRRHAAYSVVDTGAGHCRSSRAYYYCAAADSSVARNNRFVNSITLLFRPKSVIENPCFFATARRVRGPTDPFDSCPFSVVCARARATFSPRRRRRDRSTSKTIRTRNGRPRSAPAVVGPSTRVRGRRHRRRRKPRVA